jgi:hypothetical protein
MRKNDLFENKSFMKNVQKARGYKNELSTILEENEDILK